MAISQSDLFGQLLPLPGNEPAYLGLARGLRGLTMDGRLAVATRLPSERVLAEHLGVSRTTVTRAYAELVDAGWALARQGSGTYVRLPAGERTPSLPLVPGLHADAIDLSAAAGLAPSGTAELIGRALEWLPTTLASAGYEPFGAPHLSGQIARWYSDRGLPTDPEQIVVTPGALAAIGVALAATVKPGERV
ncbi:MAG: GntR family transcriptional regulator, partial [Propionicimonas sp.]